MLARRLAAALALFALAAPALAATSVDPALLDGMKPRLIGPAGMSGRIAAIEGVDRDPNILYVGAASGGVWKSVNGGLSWTPVFDDQPVASIGAIDTFAPNPDIVWVGTGEGNPRNSTSVGRGIYKSLYGGRTWTFMGLEKTERIKRIVTHPNDPDIVYVTALGRAWGENPERGVYKTTDGGKTWKRILYVDERTGASDIAMDPSNPDHLIASMWQFRRWPYFFRSGGPGSGLHVTYDGGEHWKKLTPEDGLPEGDLGRIGVAFAPSDPEIVYAMVEAGKSAVLRSEDGGETWKAVLSGPNVVPRAFYYADVMVDPENANRVYALQTVAQVSDDGGKSFRPWISPRQVHVDHHALWIDPHDGRHIVDGNDGGIAITRDRGKTWDFVANLPLAQFYHVRVDHMDPYHVMGGMQDNGSWRGPAELRENGGIRNHHWQEVGFGDGFDVAADPDDPLAGYAMSQEGNIIRWDVRTGERKAVRPPPPADGTELRFNWNAAFAQDPFDPATIYFGSQFVHKSTDRGESWTIISPDLTTNNPDWQHQAQSGGLSPDVTGAENYTTIVALTPSPHEQGVIWAGTDDGRVQLTRDGGKSWTSLEKRARGVPANSWVSSITVSANEPTVAYVTFDNHRRSDWTPYVYRVEDYGKRWRRLADDGVDGYALSFAEDPGDPDILFLGTEFGLHVSLDRGRSWFRWSAGFPTAAVKDLAIQPEENDLVIATHGRAAWIIDDIAPLRRLKALDPATRMALLGVTDGERYRVAQTGASRFPGAEEFRGKNEPYGAIFTLYFAGDDLPHPDADRERARLEKKRVAERAKPAAEWGPKAAAPEEAAREKREPAAEAAAPGDKKEPRGPKVTIEIRDAAGKTVRTIKAPVKQGVNRIVWDLEGDPLPRFPDAKEGSIFRRTGGGLPVVPGRYHAVIRFGDTTAEADVTVRPDPRFRLAASDWQANHAALERVAALQGVAVEAVKRILATRADLEALERLAKEARAAEKKSDADAEEKEGGAGRAAAAQERDRFSPFFDALKAAKKALAAAEKAVRRPPETRGIPKDTDAMSKINRARFTIASQFAAPTPAQRGYLEDAERALAAAIERVNAVFSGEIAQVRGEAEKLGLSPLPVRPPLAMPSREEGE
ncbi:MAG: hypothetical protein ACE5ED_01055 [Rhodothalassiaceae bacterium]